MIAVNNVFKAKYILGLTLVILCDLSQCVSSMPLLIMDWHQIREVGTAPNGRRTCLMTPPTQESLWGSLAATEP